MRQLDSLNVKRTSVDARASFGAYHFVVSDGTDVMGNGKLMILH